MKLNPPQYEAVTTRSGPMLVLAGAGTGKTRVVTYRISWLIRQGVAPQRILAVTFTNKAAGEMQERVAELIGKRRKQKPEISTFHSLCVRILRRRIDRLGYPLKFAIYDRGDQEGVARTVLREIRIAEATLRPGDLLYHIGQWKSHGVRPDQSAMVAQTDKEHLAASGYRRYQKALRTAGAVDFDDLLLLTEELFDRFPDARREEAERFDHILVDEYQDTNTSQYRIVRSLAAGHRNLCVVGDDDQAIYGWRGAEVAHILRFSKDWPEAKVIRLETNYRSTREILLWANRLIAFNKVRHGKTLQATCRGEAPRILQLADEELEATTVVEEIRDRIRTSKRHARDFAILCRTNEQPRSFEMELRRCEVPYVLLGGQSFYDRKEVRDILAYLKLAANPRDEIALLRVINVPQRGIGQTTVRRLTKEAIRQGRPLWDVVASGGGEVTIVPAVGAAIEGFRALIEGFRQRARSERLPELIGDLIEKIDYQKELQRQYEKAEDRESRWRSVEEVVNASASYLRRAEKPSLVDFLQELALNGPTGDDGDKEAKLARDAVVLMTMHAAKGLEFPEVYLVGMEEGILPHKRSVGEEDTVAEERRLCYVGVTRAQRRLTLTLALSRKKWGKPRPTILSRFLYELTGQADNPNYASSIRQELPKKRG